MKIVKIEWLDICSGTPNWQYIDSVVADVMRCVSFGMVIKETDELICIAQNYDADDELVSDTMTFPKAIVTKVTVIEED